jgi:glycosyltransferase involved in cell wall biosynthesis
MTFSIITVVYNGKNLIEGTIQSVIHQTYKDIEYLIVDGASKDGTVEIIKKQAEKYPIRWISERDKGLYDAMNKGLTLATGDFVLFLNAGDRLFSSDTIERIAACATPQTDILYGETMLVNEQYKHIGTRSELTVQKLPENLTWKSMNKGMVVCHQAFLPRLKLTPQYMPNNLAADIDWVIQTLQKAQKIVNTHIIVSEYLMGGISKTQHQQSLKDRYEILKKHFGYVPNIFNHFWILLRGIFFKIFNKNSY